jgi:transcriptional regulator with PAS, ATPase and Fis domain
MKPALQGKLLRVLQEREYEPVGAVKPIPADIRVIAATHRDLETAIAERTFREDLFYRLSVIPIVIPPLRERREDIPLLIEKFLQVFNRNRKVVFQGFDEEAMQALMAYHWPGNVRELENLVQRMSVLQGGTTARLADLPEKFLGREAPAGPAKPAGAPLESDPWENGSIDFDAIISDVEERLILQALQRADGNKKEAARLLNIKRTTLLQKIKRKQIGL